MMHSHVQRVLHAIYKITRLRSCMQKRIQCHRVLAPPCSTSSKSFSATDPQHKLTFIIKWKQYHWHIHPVYENTNSDVIFVQLIFCCNVPLHCICLSSKCCPLFNTVGILCIVCFLCFVWRCCCLHCTLVFSILFVTSWRVVCLLVLSITSYR